MPRKETGAKGDPLTRVRIQAVGWQPQGGMVASAPWLVGIFTATLHGELLQPWGIWTLISNCRKWASHRTRVCYHLERKKKSRGTQSGLIIERVWKPWGGTDALRNCELYDLWKNCHLPWICHAKSLAIKEDVSCVSYSPWEWPHLSHCFHE